MKLFDRLLQQWRIAIVRPYIPSGARLLDIGCGDGALFRCLKDRLVAGMGIDADLEHSVQQGSTRLIAGRFPDDCPEDLTPFDIITILAVLEHFPPDQQRGLAQRCASLLRPGGYLVITVPSPAVDRILHLLKRLPCLYEGRSLEEHYGFDVRMVPLIFHDLRLVVARKFQLGLNNLFVFQKGA